MVKSIIGIEESTVGILLGTLFVLVIFFSFLGVLLPQFQDSSQDIADVDAPLTNLFSSNGVIVMVLVAAAILISLPLLGIGRGNR